MMPNNGMNQSKTRCAKSTLLPVITLRDCYDFVPSAMAIFAWFACR
jgi:hypothetical protein